MSTKRGGFSKSLFLSEPSSHLLCTLCNLVFDEPVINGSCGHCFCKTCISHEAKTTNLCPVCAAPISTTFAPNCLIGDMVSDQHVNCFTTRDREGAKCPWTGKLLDAQEHLKDCKYKQIRCKNAECKMMIQARDGPAHEKVCRFTTVECDHCHRVFAPRDITAHEAQCGMRQVSCEYCKQDINSRDMAAHLTECGMRKVPCDHCHRVFNPKDILAHVAQCGMRPVPCTNFCNMIVPYMELDYHCVNNCAKQPVDCPISYLGICKECEGRVPRDEVNGHIKLYKGTENVVSLLFEKISTLTREQEDVTHRLDECVKENAYISLQNVVYKLAQEHTLLGYNNTNQVPFAALASWVNDLDIAHDMETIDLLNAQLRTATDPNGNKCVVQHVEFEYHHKELANPSKEFCTSSVEKTIAPGITASVHVERASNDRMVKFYGKVMGYEGEYECATTLLRLGNGKPFQAMSRVHSGNYQFCKLKTSRLVEDGYIDEDENKLRILVSFMLPLDGIKGHGGAKKQKF